MVEDTVGCPQRIISKSESMIMMSNSECKKVDENNWNTEGGEEPWGSKLLSMVMDNVRTQWIEDAIQRSWHPTKAGLKTDKKPDIVGGYIGAQ